MPSQFRFFGSEPPPGPVTESSDSIATTPPPTSAQFVSISPSHASPPPTNAEEADENQGLSSGLHDVVKKTDFWFNLQLSQLEKYAVEMAVAWATAGIPRQDAPADGELPVETTLKARAIEIFREWVSRVKRKVQDAVQSASNDASEGVIQLRHGLTQLERTTVEIEATEAELREREEALLSQQKTFGAEPLFKHKYVYLPLLLAIALIEWIANVPIFSELLPEEPGTRLIWRKLVAETQQHGAWGGVQRVWEKVLLYPDVAIFAFGVIIFLLVLAHVGGDSARELVVFNPKDEPLLAPTIDARRRQAWLPLAASILGIFLAIGFLAFSRAKLETAAAAGNARAQAEVERLESELQAFSATGKQLTDVQHQLDVQQQLDAARSRAKDWNERARFASDIVMMNWPIFFLNTVLAITAFIASYCVAAPRITEGRLVDPLIPGLRETLELKQKDAISMRQALRGLDSSVQAALARCRYLASTRPLEEWQAKAKRLNAVVPLFRAENARARGVDPESIIAFRQPCTIELPEIPDESFQLPPEVAAIEGEFRELRYELHSQGSRRQVPSVPVGAGL